MNKKNQKNDKKTTNYNIEEEQRQKKIMSKKGEKNKRQTKTKKNEFFDIKKIFVSKRSPFTGDWRLF